MEKGKNLISLKEAADISGYSSDYIGQLIRGGKIFGEQVYSNVTWMTSEEDILAYKNKSRRVEKEQSTFFLSKKRQIAIQFKILKIVFDNSKSAILLLAFLFFIFLLFVTLIFSIIFSNNNFSELNIQENDNIQIEY